MPHSNRSFWFHRSEFQDEMKGRREQKKKLRNSDPKSIYGEIQSWTHEDIASLSNEQLLQVYDALLLLSVDLSDISEVSLNDREKIPTLRNFIQSEILGRMIKEI